MLIQNSEKSSTVSEENDIHKDDFLRLARLIEEADKRIEEEKKEKEDK